MTASNPPDLPATHQAFGLTWHFPFPFPPFRTAPPGGHADVAVALGELPPPSVAARQAGPLRLAAPGEVRFGLPGVAKVQVSNGNHILVERHADASEEALRLLLMGAISALVLHQRGYLPLHGSAIATPKGAVLFVGHSGAGKSTTLGAFLKRGYPMVCDDLAAIRLDAAGVARVYPGVPLYKLWADSAEALGVATGDLPRVRTELEKYLVPAGDCQVASALPVHAVYQLSSHNDAGIGLEHRVDADKFNALLDHTWQKLTVKRMGLHTDHFRRAIAMANTVRVVSVRRPQLDTVDTGLLADRIEADFLA